MTRRPVGGWVILAASAFIVVMAMGVAAWAQPTGYQAYVNACFLGECEDIALIAPDPTIGECLDRLVSAMPGDGYVILSARCEAVQ